VYACFRLIDSNFIFLFLQGDSILLVNWPVWAGSEFISAPAAGWYDDLAPSPCFDNHRQQVEASGLMTRNREPEANSMKCLDVDYGEAITFIS
jgi:hypothetical protein